MLLSEVVFVVEQAGAEPLTEKEWLAGNTFRRMLDYLRGKATNRKLRLFAAACCRRVGRLLAEEERARRAVEVAEQFADGHVTEDELAAAQAEVWPLHGSGDQGRSAALHAAGYAAGPAAWDAAWDAAGYTARALAAGHQGPQQPVQAALLLDIFGNPFRPATAEGAWRAWNQGMVARLAQGIYDERAFDGLPILADALLDAGCDNEDILSHCHAHGPHVRGCWVIDLMLGNE
jgi:hypothetical protein